MPTEPTNKLYTDAEYLAIIAQKQHMYAWTLETFGGYSRDNAQVRAEMCYPFDPVGQNNPFLFHDRAWHYAMIELHGSTFWTSKQELLNAPAAYYEKEQRFGREQLPEDRRAH